MQLSSSRTQNAGTGGGIPIQLENVDGISGMGHNLAVPSAISIEQNGLYLIIAGLQARRKNANKSYFLDAWLRVSNTTVTDIKNSNTRLRFPKKSKQYTNVLSLNTVLCLREGDTLQVIFAANHNSVQLVAIRPDREPVIPAAIITVTRLHDC